MNNAVGKHRLVWLYCVISDKARRLKLPNLLPNLGASEIALLLAFISFVVFAANQIMGLLRGPLTDLVILHQVDILFAAAILHLSDLLVMALNKTLNIYLFAHAFSISFGKQDLTLNSVRQMGFGHRCIVVRRA